MDVSGKGVPALKCPFSWFFSGIWVFKDNCAFVLWKVLKIFLYCCFHV